MMENEPCFTVFLTAHKWVHFLSMTFFRAEKNHLNNPTMDWGCKTIQKETLEPHLLLEIRCAPKTEEHQPLLKMALLCFSA